MSLGLEKVVLLISSYSNPVETLRHANKEGYILRDFLLTNMPFGTYSSELKVMHLTSSTMCLPCTLPSVVSPLNAMVRGLVGRWVLVKKAYNVRLQTRSGASSYSGRVCMHAQHVLAT